jgi:hypothetical protein
MAGRRMARNIRHQGHCKVPVILLNTSRNFTFRR